MRPANLKIDDRQWERLARGECALERANRRHAPFNQRRSHSPPGQHLLQNSPIGGVVVYHQHIQSLEILHSTIRRRHRQRGADLEWQRDVNPRAARGLALYVDRSPHQLGQTLRDGEPQSRSSESTRRRSVRLREWVEDRGVFFFRYPDSRVAYAERHRHPLGVDALAVHTHDHFARLGELHRVADQIDHDLTKPRRIAAERGRKVGPDLAGELESLGVGARRERAQSVGNRVAWIEIDHVDFELARLDLGEVEDIVDDSEQCVAGRSNRFEILALFRGHVRSQRKIGHADDAVHRRADLVAHVGEEFALRLARRFRCVATLACFGRLAQRALGRRLFRVKTSKLCAHVDEALLELADLARSDAADLSLEIARSDLARYAREECDRPNQKTGDGHRGAESEREHDQGEDHEPDAERRGAHSQRQESGVECDRLLPRQLVESREDRSIVEFVQRVAEDRARSSAPVRKKQRLDRIGEEQRMVHLGPKSE